ncbi:MAG: hypothetical protein AAB373_01495 [Patescibacteria group bacterium]
MENRIDYQALKGSVSAGFNPQRLTDQELIRLSQGMGRHLFVSGYSGETLHLTTLQELPHGGLSKAGLCRQEIHLRLQEGSLTDEQIDEILHSLEQRQNRALGISV